MDATTRPTESPVDVEFRVRDRDCFFVEASDAVERRVSLEHFVNRSDGQLMEYCTVEDAAPDRVRSMAADADTVADARLVSRGVDGVLFEFEVSGPCVTTTLADAGAIVQSVTAADGVGRVVASVPPHVEVRQVVETFRRRHPHTDLVARHDSGGTFPVQTEQGVQVALLDRLTEKQAEVLRTAYRAGYFSWPRTCTATDCADALGIAQPTFSQHVRVAQEKVFGGLFDGSSRNQ
ncbi:bacterio-opsin activator domain-containing protein [Haloarchaeobius sp. HRN-SO-5]|uniref:helix-turn-helix domain-containing protein n=1 Tax=Haloarchaeobius sp. HRN-SO-5 TaxID=3446118 RepID=UPI003EBC0EE7